MDPSLLRAIFLLLGTIIGAGIFAIPYVTARVGYPIGLIWLILLTLVTILVKLSYARVILKDARHYHQLTGYGQHYFGKVGKWLALAILVIGQWGVIVAYLAGMGDFAALLLGRPNWSFVASNVIFLLGTVILLSGLRRLLKLEAVITLFMITLVLLLSLLSLPKLQLDNLVSWRIAPLTREIFLPYGVILGALNGVAVLPEAARVLGVLGKEVDNEAWKKLRKVVWLSVLSAGLVYACFQFSVVGINGTATSPEAIQGLQKAFPSIIVQVGALFGILAMGTSYLGLSYVLKDMFELDLGRPIRQAWMLALLPPWLIFALGLRDFVTAFGLSGAWMGTLSAAFILALYIKAQVVQSHYA